MRLIDADALIKRIKAAAWKPTPAAEISKSICLGFAEDAPTIDAVTVVRCKDCKHYSKEGCWCNRNSHFDDDVYSMNWNDFGEDDFCSYGERKDCGQINARMPEAAGRTSERGVRTNGEDERAGNS